MEVESSQVGTREWLSSGTPSHWHGKPSLQTCLYLFVVVVVDSSGIVGRSATAQTPGVCVCTRTILQLTSNTSNEQWVVSFFPFFGTRTNSCTKLTTYSCFFFTFRFVFRKTMPPSPLAHAAQPRNPLCKKLASRYMDAFFLFLSLPSNRCSTTAATLLSFTCLVYTQATHRPLLLNSCPALDGVANSTYRPRCTALDPVAAA